MTNYNNNNNNNNNNNRKQYSPYLVECYYHKGTTGGKWFYHADKIELDGGTAQSICHLWNRFAISENLNDRMYYVASAKDEDDARIQGRHLHEGI